MIEKYFLFWVVYILVILLFVIRIKFLEYQLIKYAKDKSPDIFKAYQLSQGDGHPWSIFSKKLRNILKMESFYDSKIVILVQKIRRMVHLLILWFFLIPLLILVLYLLPT
jgi:hypothetical protein